MRPDVVFSKLPYSYVPTIFHCSCKFPAIFLKFVYSFIIYLRAFRYEDLVAEPIITNYVSKPTLAKFVSGILSIIFSHSRPDDRYFANVCLYVAHLQGTTATGSSVGGSAGGELVY
ncbi:hypothetical protein EDD21DRAFT_421994 [Dissophora ornata]|nr:hypothetical protein EDD21DRAFT_421994 [Dissophora ornata]